MLYKIQKTLIIGLLGLGNVVFSQTSAIKGKVSTSDGQPAEMVNVGLVGTKKGTTTNESGNYSIEKLEAGKYTLQFSMVGLETSTQEVELKPDETLTVDFTLKENSKFLQEVVITGTKSLNEKTLT